MMGLELLSMPGAAATEKGAIRDTGVHVVHRPLHSGASYAGKDNSS